MIRGKNRKKYDGRKALVVKELANQYEYSPDYIRKCINGDRESEVAEEIKREYKRLYRSLEKIVSVK